jgi:hypothetical protein
MLSVQKLENGIRTINDPSFQGFGGFPEDIKETSERWGDIMLDFVSDITPPSTTLNNSINSFKFEILKLNYQTGYFHFINAFTLMASQLALGMNPTFSAVPPPIPLDIRQIISKGLNGASSPEIARDLSDTIFKWLITGTAINNSTGVTINWR